MKHPLQKLRQRLPELKQQMDGVRFSDEGQKRAFGNLARFFAVMLVLTLVARGTANATMPQVDATHPMRGSITQNVTLSGMVSAAGRTGVPCPAGITVAELLVLPGEQVQAGQAIARFDEEEVERLLARAKVQMKKLAAQKQSQADAGRQPDAGGVGSAQQALDWP